MLSVVQRASLQLEPSERRWFAGNLRSFRGVCGNAGEDVCSMKLLQRLLPHRVVPSVCRVNAEVFAEPWMRDALQAAILAGSRGT